MAIGAYLADLPGANDVGQVFLISGIDGSTLLVISGPVADGGLGHEVAGPGDVTGDGVPDVLSGSVSLAQARLYSGSDGSLVYSWNVLGYAFVGAPGDTNGDGVPDLLAGAPQAYGFAGSAHVFSGADGSTLVSLVGPSYPNCALFGNRVAGTGDLDGDGLGDFVVGAPQHGAICGFASGSAHVYSGNGTLLGVLWGDNFGPGAGFGRFVGGIGDVSGDGVPDFAVNGNDATFPAWALYIFSGADRSLISTIAGGAYGFYVWQFSTCGDVDGDGVPDLAAGSPGSPPVVPNVGTAGRAIVYSGADWSILFDLLPPPNELLNFGSDFCDLGDVTSDGFPEVVVSAAGTYVDSGKVRAYSGAPMGVVAFGAGCPGTGGIVPRIGATRSPQVGTTFKLNLSRTIPATGALLILGFSSSAWWGVPLPMSLGPLGLPGCSLFVSPDCVVGLPTTSFGPGNGRAVAQITLPNVGGLVGATFYAQWYVVDPGPSAIPGAMTRALAVTLQP